jgi:hypothetical protein
MVKKSPSFPMAVQSRDSLSRHQRRSQLRQSSQPRERAETMVDACYADEDGYPGRFRNEEELPKVGPNLRLRCGVYY